MWLAKDNELININRIRALTIPSTKPSSVCIVYQDDAKYAYELVCADNDEARAVLKAVTHGLIRGQYLLDWEIEKSKWCGNEDD